MSFQSTNEEFGYIDTGAFFYREADSLRGAGVVVDGKEWAQPRLFAELSWNEINSVCSTGICEGHLNGYDVTGWSWASVEDVNGLFNHFLGAPHPLGPGPDSVREVDSRWAEMFFTGRFWFTQKSGLTARAYGYVSDSAPHDSSHGMVAKLNDESSPFVEDLATTNEWTNNKDHRHSLYGAWLYRPAP